MNSSIDNKYQVSLNLHQNDCIFLIFIILLLITKCIIVLFSTIILRSLFILSWLKVLNSLCSFIFVFISTSLIHTFLMLKKVTHKRKVNLKNWIILNFKIDSFIIFLINFIIYNLYYKFLNKFSYIIKYPKYAFIINQSIVNYFLFFFNKKLYKDFVIFKKVK